MILKLVTLIERIPWQIFIMFIALFLMNIVNNVSEFSVIIYSSVGCACMTFLAVHNHECQIKRRRLLQRHSPKDRSGKPLP